ncbi:DUF982 domain-containing protein [Aliirhizobium smilacinae]|uniref:DUF982 domain-containing protein n=1 Tax=Aliirhizobium smilacinae TaxID=1395944 RepID=A0A5C4XK97_9HYPH|nr:DUF982 domain-containing protein [Rhizobium smilacinae]TNM62934.1 DUF982 domain-containing protein [Rhizobium smilacinae]
MSGPNSRWNKPVEISLPATGSHQVLGPFEALTYLTENWPAGQGLTFVKARSACRGALAGHKTVDEARIAFEAAASEARKQFDKSRH